MKTRSVNEAMQAAHADKAIRDEARKAMAKQILFDLAHQWHRGEKANYEYIARRVALLGDLPAEGAWETACKVAGEQVDADDEDAGDR